MTQKAKGRGEEKKKNRVLGVGAHCAIAPSAALLTKSLRHHASVLQRVRCSRARVPVPFAGLPAACLLINPGPGRPGSSVPLTKGSDAIASCKQKHSKADKACETQEG